MEKKLFVLVVTLVTIFASVTVPQNIEVEASGDYGDPDLDHDYIYNKIVNLSRIITYEKFQPKGRWFGEPGENKSAQRIEGWMNDIGLDCVHNETIDACWNQADEGDGNSLYIGPLNQLRQMQDDFYVNISVWEGNTLVEYKNLSFGESFPFFTFSGGDYRIDQGKKRLYEDFWPGRPGFELCDIHWLNGWKHIGRIDEQFGGGKWAKGLMGLPNYRGYIAIDNSTDTHPQIPPGYDHLDWLVLISKPGYYVNKTIGDWIRDRLYEKEGGVLKYKLYVDYCTHWEKVDVTSYNVIGQINGTDTGNVSIIGAHYDCMWNGGAIDEAAETVLVLGIAKLIKDRELESKLKHTVKFIAFGGEEIMMRGARDYVKDNIIDETGPQENVIYVINPGNFGHYNRSGYDYDNNLKLMDFTLASFNESMSNLAKNITDALDYSSRTDVQQKRRIKTVPEIGLPPEDSMIFGLPNKDYADTCIEFHRFPYSQYHRDGLDHTKGDTIENLDNLTFHVESEAVASVALHLLLDHNFSFVNCSNSTFDSNNDGKFDSVTLYFNGTSDTNVSLFGNITGCLYNITTGDPVSKLNASGLIPFITGNNTAGHINVTLINATDAIYDDYTAKLVLKDVFENVHDECNQIVNVSPYGSPIADFSWQVGVPPPKNITFTDESLPSYNGTITSWNWSFGDGNYSTDQNPNHTYEYAGLYDVTLTIEDSNNLTANVTKTVAVFDLCADVSFNKSKNIEKIGKNVRFDSTSSDPDGTITNTKWYFGDGTTGTGTYINHSYSNGGRYTITLEVTDNDGATNSTTDTILIANEFADDNFPEEDPDDGNWTTIQAAVNNASDGNVIYVFNGDYNNITVDKEVSLYGEGNVIITGQQTAVDVQCDNVTFEGFKVENSVTGIRLSRLSNTTVTNCSVQNCTTGLKLESEADNNIISDCDFINNTYGILLTDSDENFIGSPDTIMDPVWNNCNFSLNRYGVYLSNSNNNIIFGCDINALNADPFSMELTSGIYIDNSNDNYIFCCDIYDANNYGIYMSGSSENRVRYNIIRDNDKGIYLSGSSDNNFIKNNISDNTKSGINILTVSCSSNSIYFNDFIDNGGILYPQASDSGTGNRWNSTGTNTFLYNTPGEGNNWSDYTGSDSDGDGIGDTAYSIAGTANAVDSYPVMEEYGWVYQWF